MLGNRYDYIIIDCSPNLGQLTLNALVAADETYLPGVEEYLREKEMEKNESKSVREKIREKKEKSNKGLRKVKEKKKDNIR